jgi:tetratricopeptide (TPR) repeat protein
MVRPLLSIIRFSESLVLLQFTNMQYRYLYERGDFESASFLLHIAESYCLEHPEDSELILADIYGAYAARDSECNNLQLCLVNFQKQFDYLSIAIKKGQVQRPTVREALAYGGLANANMGLKKYDVAEGLYRQCLKLWEDCPGDPSIYIPHLGACLTLLDKVDEAEDLLTKCIHDREVKFGIRDTTSYR